MLAGLDISELGLLLESGLELGSFHMTCLQELAAHGDAALLGHEARFVRCRVRSHVRGVRVQADSLGFAREVAVRSCLARVQIARRSLRLDLGSHRWRCGERADQRVIRLVLLDRQSRQHLHALVVGSKPSRRLFYGLLGVRVRALDSNQFRVVLLTRSWLMLEELRGGSLVALLSLQLFAPGCSRYLAHQ